MFRSKMIKTIAVAGLDEARRSAGFTLLAYVIMPDHLHVATDSARKTSDSLRFIKGIISHQVMECPKERGHRTSLEKLRDHKKEQGHEYSLWQHRPNVALLPSERMVRQRLKYIHPNPLRAGLATGAEDYRWSRAQCCTGQTLEDAPLRLDLSQISWRKDG